MNRVWPILLLSAASGCAVVRTLSAPKDDYAAYRRTRVAPTREAKLAASWRYLRDVPDGRWREQVSEWFDAHEPAYYEDSRNDVPKLRAYLANLPGGPHAAEVEERLDALQLSRAVDRRNNRLLSERAQKLEQRLASAQSQRRELVQTFAAWVARFVAIGSWGKPTSELDHELIFAWRLDPPRGRCAGGRCVKALELPYAVPDARSISKRTALFDVVFVLDARGGISRAVLLGPELFSRIGEAADVRAVAPGDALARAEAIGRVVEIVGQAAEAKLPDKTCGREAISPVVLERECRGLRLRVIAALGSEEEDRIEVEPTARMPDAAVTTR